MFIKYGVINKTIDVTNICLFKLMNNNIITIPAGDGNRANIFSDPLHGVLKKIFIINNNNLTEYDDSYTIKIDIKDNSITTISNNDINDKITNIHSK